jgi:hypothetical protein
MEWRKYNGRLQHAETSGDDRRRRPLIPLMINMLHKLPILQPWLQDIYILPSRAPSPNGTSRAAPARRALGR